MGLAACLRVHAGKQAFPKNADQRNRAFWSRHARSNMILSPEFERNAHQAITILMAEDDTDDRLLVQEVFRCGKVLVERARQH